MRKEILFAIIAGAVFGLIIAVGFWRARSFIKPEQKDTQVTTNDSNQKTNSDLLDLALAFPENESVVTEKKVIITGSTLPNTLVAVSTETEDVITSSDSEGNFSVDTSAISGVNEVVVVSADPIGQNSVEKRIAFVYSSQLEDISSNTDDEEADSATNSADEVRQKVQDRIDEVLNNPKAYIGSITDISEDTLQITKIDFTGNGSNGEIVQVSVTEDSTDYVDTSGDTNKTIKFDDVAIGDFVIAMGTTDENDVLEARRILVADTIEPTGRSIILGNITKVDEIEDSLTFNNAKGEITAITNKSTDFLTGIIGNNETIDFTELERGNNIIIITSLDEGDTVARTIYLIPTVVETNTNEAVENPE